jgi:hypothetical protein
LCVARQDDVFRTLIRDLDESEKTVVTGAFNQLGELESVLSVESLQGGVETQTRVSIFVDLLSQRLGQLRGAERDAVRLCGTDARRRAGEDPFWGALSERARAGTFSGFDEVLEQVVSHLAPAAG